jgi:hypothetical protein
LKEKGGGREVLTRLGKYHPTGRKIFSQCRSEFPTEQAGLGGVQQGTGKLEAEQMISLGVGDASGSRT